VKELKILAIVVAISAVLYIGIEPFAHSQMHPHVAPADFSFEDLEKNSKTGDAKRGAQTFMMAGCTGCHGVASQGIPAPMDDETASLSFGVIPPDLNWLQLWYKETLKINAGVKDATRWKSTTVFTGV
jgi:ubiquinol-cytochrome c reductase cytochrome c1 subunit